MGILDEFNKEVVIYEYDLPEDKRNFYNLSEIYNSGVYHKEVKGFFINTKGKYGENAIVVSDDCFISLPQHLTEVVKKMMHNTTITELINKGMIYLRIRPYNKGNNTYYSVVWLDRENTQE